jgi:hypothetical protein
MAVALTLACLVATSCTDDDGATTASGQIDGSTTTSGTTASTPDSTSTASTATSAPLTTSTVPSAASRLDYLPDVALPALESHLSNLGYQRFGPDDDCPVYAEENRLVVILTPDDDTSPQELLNEATGRIAETFDLSFDVVPIDSESEGPPTAFVLQLNRSLTDEEVQGLGDVQGLGFSVDLDYLVPLLPHNGLRPGDDPEEAVEPIEDAPLPADAHVLVVDSAPPDDEALLPDRWHAARRGSKIVTPSNLTAEYDRDQDGFTDDVAGHGPFVAFLIERHATADITLQPVVDVSGEAPLVFSESDLIRSLQQATGLAWDSGEARFTSATFDVVNLSLGSLVCEIGDVHRTLARMFWNLMLASDPGNPEAPFLRRGVFTAAAGNFATDRLHTPAAFASAEFRAAFASSPDQMVLEEQTLIAGELAEHVAAVGALDASGSDPACFSNHGEWVNVWAPGQDQVSVYLPDADTTGSQPPGTRARIDNNWASWGGTSFATARVSAAVAAAMTAQSTTAYEAWRSIRTVTITPPGLLIGGNAAIQPTSPCPPA